MWVCGGGGGSRGGALGRRVVRNTDEEGVSWEGGQKAVSSCFVCGRGGGRFLQPNRNYANTHACIREAVVVYTHCPPPIHTYAHTRTHTHSHSHVCAHAYIHSHIYKDAVNIRGRYMTRCCDTCSMHAGHAYKWFLAACIDAWIHFPRQSPMPVISKTPFGQMREGSLMGQYSRHAKNPGRCSDARSGERTKDQRAVDELQRCQPACLQPNQAA